MRYLDICSGISAPTVAWKHLGWQACAYAEIDRFPSSVLKHHYPDVENVGDFTKIGGSDYAADLMVGGTPCQDFSVAGLRAGLDGARGQLTIEYARLAERLRPRWLLWENVPGVLSADAGRAFGFFLRLLGQCGYGFAYRVFDAQYAGVPQRRRRVFLVGHLGDHRRAAAVLFDRESMHGHPPPSRKAGQIVAALTADGVGTCGADDNQGQAGHLIAHSLRANGFDASEDGTGRGTPLVPVAFGGNNTTGAIDVATALNACGTASGRQDFETEPFIAHTLKGNRGAGGGGLGPEETLLPVAFTCKDHGSDVGELSPTLRSMGHDASHANAGGQVAVATEYAVRRLTPRECERLQGFPDDYTLVPYRGKPAVDGPRYKALGNSMAVPDVRWIGERIAAVDRLEFLRVSA